ncbi:MOSC domain-containing protein [Spongiactinospora sp. 9N601]|uniref:MOSC domain-containing protein n=1 Tax=Spongiactinospora sp. 9N601 TaxID=3375149 RepID=UPI0037BBBDC9
MKILSLNVGRAKPVPYTDAPSGATGIDKRPVEGPVRVAAPGAQGSGMAGDDVCDIRMHGGDDRAVYAFAREDLDRWEHELGRPLPNGTFGENLTTIGVDLNDVLVGERWRVGPEVVLEVTGGRIPCRTFAGWLAEKGWVRRFTQSGSSGAMLRVIEPGELRTGDAIEVVHRPEHDVTVARLFRAVTTERAELPKMLVAAPWMESEQLSYVRNHMAKYHDGP